jgi:hypothetical protein
VVHAEQTQSVEPIAPTTVASPPQLTEAAAKSPQLDEPNAAEQSATLSADDQWQQAIEQVDGMLKDYAAIALRAIETKTNEWQIVFPQGSETLITIVSSPENRQKLTKAIQATTGRHIQLSFIRSEEPARTSVDNGPAQSEVSQSQRKREAAEHPLIRRIIDVLDGEIVRIDRVSAAPPRPNVAESKPVRSPS